jgi:hypothetical protein
MLLLVLRFVLHFDQEEKEEEIDVIGSCISC